MTLAPDDQLQLTTSDLEIQIRTHAELGGDEGNFTTTIGARKHVLVTNGCIEALNLALRAVAQPGDTVAVEPPTHYGLLQVLGSLGMRDAGLRKLGTIVVNALLRRSRLRARLGDSRSSSVSRAVVYRPEQWHMAGVKRCRGVSMTII
jgi:hypothetical protein